MPTITIYLNNESFFFLAEVSKSKPSALGKMIIEEWITKEKNEKQVKKGYGQLKFKLGHDGAGVVSSAGYGDGLYPVYATFNKEGRIKKIEVVFIED